MKRFSKVVFGHEVSFGFDFRKIQSRNLKKRDGKIIAGYKQGYSISRLAKKYNLTENRISQIVTGAGVRQRKWRKMRPESRKLIFRLFKKGLSKAEIGRHVGVTRERVRQILAEK